MTAGPKDLRGVIFDLDGTVVENDYDWPRIKEELGTSGEPILTYLEGLDEPERTRKWGILECHEAVQTGQARLRKGMKELLEFLAEKGVFSALVTNNSEANTTFLLNRFELAFDCVITRESGLWKPSGAPFLEVMEKLGLEPGECCVLGDTRFDILAALDAGIGIIFLLTEDPDRFAGFPVEVFSSIIGLRKRIEQLVGS